MHKVKYSKDYINMLELNNFWRNFISLHISGTFKYSVEN